MTKRYSKRTTKKTTVKLSPKEAEDIIKSEFTDEKDNRHILRFRFKPHLPTEEGDMQLRYKMNNDNNNRQGEE